QSSYLYRITNILIKGQSVQRNKFEVDLVGVRQACAVVQRTGDARGPQWQATVVGPPPQEINLIS
ncbi:unnamed protein product, partial [Musa acuminata subsp. burmannicoides]